MDILFASFSQWNWGSELDRKTEFLELLKFSPSEELLTQIEPSFANLIVDEEEDQTVLHFATKENDILLVELLLENGANVNPTDRDGTTPLHIASANNSTEIIALLLRHKANINSQNSFGSTPLHIAAFQGQLTAVELLIDNGANTNCQDSDGRTPLHGAALKGELSICEALTKGNAIVDLQEKDGKTALQTAVHNGQLSVVKFLVECGADINTRTNQLETPLHRAVICSLATSFEILSFLIKKGADANSINRENKIPLHLAFQAMRDVEEDAVLEMKIQTLIEHTDLYAIFQGAGIPEEKAKVYQRILVANNFHTQVYGSVDEEHLIRIGISSHGHRMKIEKILQFLSRFSLKIR